MISPSLFSLWTDHLIHQMRNGGLVSYQGTRAYALSSGEVVKNDGLPSREFVEKMLETALPGEKLGPDSYVALFSQLPSRSPEGLQPAHDWPQPGEPWMEIEGADWRDRALARLYWLGADLPLTKEEVEHSGQHTVGGFYQEIAAAGFTGAFRAMAQGHPQILQEVQQLRHSALSMVDIAVKQGDVRLLKLLHDNQVDITSAYLHVSTPQMIRQIATLGVRPAKNGLARFWKDKRGSMEAKKLIAELDAVFPLTPEEKMLRAAVEGTWTHLAAAAKEHPAGLAARLPMGGKWTLSAGSAVLLRPAPHQDSVAETWVKMSLRAWMAQPEGVEIAPGIPEMEFISLLVERNQSTASRKAFTSLSFPRSAPLTDRWISWLDASEAAGESSVRAQLWAMVVDKMLRAPAPRPGSQALKIELAHASEVARAIKLAWSDNGLEPLPPAQTGMGVASPELRIEYIGTPGTAIDELWILGARLSRSPEYIRRKVEWKNHHDYMASKLPDALMKCSSEELDGIGKLLKTPIWPPEWSKQVDAISAQVQQALIEQSMRQPAAPTLRSRRM